MSIADPNLYDKLWELLSALDGVRQDPRYHPEEDALYHSLQVFEIARKDTDDAELLLAALVHDVGKAVDSSLHAEIGAELLEDIVSPRVIWLVQHHLDLLKAPKATRKRYARSPRLQDLEKLRRYDLGGRNPSAWVPPLEDVLSFLMNTLNQQKHTSQGMQSTYFQTNSALESITMNDGGPS